MGKRHRLQTTQVEQSVGHPYRVGGDFYFATEFLALQVVEITRANMLRHALFHLPPHGGSRGRRSVANATRHLKQVRVFFLPRRFDRAGAHWRVTPPRSASADMRGVRAQCESLRDEAAAGPIRCVPVPQHR